MKRTQRKIVLLLRKAAVLAAADQRPRLAKSITLLAEGCALATTETPLWIRPGGDLTGERIGTWRVQRHAGSQRNGPVWECVCVRKGCGYVRTILGSHLRNKPPRCSRCVVSVKLAVTP